MATHWRRILFVGILAAIGSPSPVDYLSLAVLLIFWQLLSLTTLADRYVSRIKRHLEQKMCALLQVKALDFFMMSHCNPYEAWSSKNKLQKISSGTVTLLGALSSAFGQFFNVWIIYREIGWYAVIPVVITLAHQLFSHLVSQKIENLRQLNQASKIPRFQDNYYSILNNIRTIKFYAWENVFIGVKAFRDNPDYVPPMVWHMASYSVDLIGCASSQISAALTIIVFFGASSKPVSYPKIALLVDSIDSLTKFTKTIASVGKTIVEINKGVDFMQTLFDVEQKVYITHVTETGEDGVAVELDNCVLSWGDNKFALDPITLCVKAGEFVTIIGRIGGGKSSLLSGLCGEMPVVGGRGHVYGKTGYVSQKPYIMNDTFRENVLMGAEYDEEWMHQVLEACALSEDVEQFAAGDLSEIGPNGINLSSSQKVRLALARALYLKADVYIFDDLLAAVDARVERLIIERVLASGGIIGDKTRILVTHAEHLVPLSSKVVTLAEGHAVIVEQQPVDFVSAVNIDEHVPDSSTETASTSNADTKSGKFTIHPELKDPSFKLWQLWRFIKLSGYVAVAIVAVIQLANVYAIYYVESLRIGLMVDSNPNTMRQSMSRYLIVNAFIEIGRMQLNSFEAWIRKVLWTKRVLEKMRRQLISSILSLPLTLFERLSSQQLVDIFTNDRNYVAIDFPQTLCNSVLFDGFLAASSILQITMASPIVVLLCLPLVSITIFYSVFFGNPENCIWRLGFLHFLYDSLKHNNIVLENRALFRIHGCADQYLDRFRASTAGDIKYNYYHRVAGSLRGILATVCVELIRSGVLMFNIYRRLYTSTLVLSGEVDVMISLSLNVFSRATALTQVFDSLENQLPALSRYYQFTEQLEREAPAVIKDASSEPSWLQNGVVEFRNYSMRYRPELDLVLKGLSFSAQGREKIGIVGRTGAGKGSITYALMRLVEPASGQIIIDGIDISTIGLHDLRSCIAIIPQDPALFKGTIRDNLDPANEYTDDEVWEAIRAGQISNLLDTPTEKYVKPLDNKNSDEGPWIEGVGLNKWVDHSGANFSVGQQQLISLCRALLWRRKIIILDEATANVDSKTDQIMQEVIRREFKECTVLTIAHRLGTVMDSDRILVMDHGQMAEFDSPENLLADKNSHFSQLVESMKLNHGN
ncbi:hypothetical protein LPJ66_004003 [Kickxella alabastrina]|uniref:Uncharacterized protein n=1 Tax=Kickxella alabastrina TaxID=61397 RepID=A0ACC1IMG1_9FUNG|nr:hypothetical protein LPJ66_004003 [Kickxella alabastrina]